MTSLPWPRRRRPRTSGRPSSPNGASSFHLWWLLPPSEPLVEVSTLLEVMVPPAVESLYFWALQVSFAEGAADRGAAHVGLQWNNRHPGSTAVNWGGYAPGGALLRGTESVLPSRPRDPNTRDYPWLPRRPYRLRITRSAGLPGYWQADVTDLVDDERVVIRELQAGGDSLRSPVVWSEVFARCDDPSVSVRWSDMQGRTSTGKGVPVRGLSVNYQSPAAGGCDNTTVRLDGRGVVQATNAERTVAGGSVVRLN